MERDGAIVVPEAEATGEFVGADRMEQLNDASAGEASAAGLAGGALDAVARWEGDVGLDGGVYAERGEVTAGRVRLGGGWAGAGGGGLAALLLPLGIEACEGELFPVAVERSVLVKGVEGVQVLGLADEGWFYAAGDAGEGGEDIAGEPEAARDRDPLMDGVGVAVRSRCSSGSVMGPWT